MSVILCRICGESQNILKFIDDQVLRAKLNVCLGIVVEESDLLPKYICEVCENGVEYSYLLRKQAQETEKRLRIALLERKNATAVGTRAIQCVTASKFDEADKWEEETLIEEIFEEVTSDNETNQAKVERSRVGQAEGATKEESAQNSDSEGVCDMEDYLESQSSRETLTVIKFAKVPSTTIATYTCETCGSVFSAQKAYSQHLREHGRQRFKCSLCSKWFPTKTRLDNHIRCHNKQLPPYKCPHCETVYAHYYNLERHIRSRHRMDRRFECDKCPEKFSRPDVLKTHRETHQQQREEYECPKCEGSRKFKTKGYLLSHMKSHDIGQSLGQPEDLAEDKEEPPPASRQIANPTKSSKSYSCHVCGKAFAHNFSLTNHLRTHTEERPFTCLDCSKEFRTAATLFTHQRIHRDQRPYQCSQCPRQFRQASHLKDHLETHAGVQRFKCSMCEMMFAKKCNLVVHLRTHTGEKPFECDQCREGFTRRQLLERHKQKVHKTTTTTGDNDTFIPEASRKFQVVSSTEIAVLNEEKTRTDGEDSPELVDDACGKAEEGESLSQYIEIVNDLENEQYYGQFLIEAGEAKSGL